MNKRTVNISFYSDLDEKRYEGSFVVKEPSVRDQANIRSRQAALGGNMHFISDPEPDQVGMGLDSETFYLNHVIAYLETVILESPDWWDLDKIEDLDLLYTVHGEVRKGTKSFRRQAAKEAAAKRLRDGSERDGEAKASGTYVDGDVSQMVEQEVQSPFDP